MKDILVHVDRTEGSYYRLQLAFDLASRHGGRLVALYALEWSEEQLEERGTAQMGLVSAEENSSLLRRQRATIDHEADEVHSAVEALGLRSGVETEWRCVMGPASDLLAQHARCADLCIVGHHRAADVAPSDYSVSEKLLFVTGRPILFVPPGERLETLGRRIAVAWNSSRAAARAVHDAMPLLERAERTTVMTVNAADFIDRNGGVPVELLLRHLAKHGAACDLVQLERVVHSSIADELQANARTLGADLLVAGAFGHPKLWEKLFGGVTRDLLDRMSLPILMST